MNFVGIVGYMSLTFVGIAGCMTLNFNVLIYSFWNFCRDKKITEVWITVILNHVYDKMANALGYKVWIVVLNWIITDCVNWFYIL